MMNLSKVAQRSIIVSDPRGLAIVQGPPSWSMPELDLNSGSLAQESAYTCVSTHV